jgi:hypothetical protein
MRYLVLFSLSLLLSACYTIVHQPSALPEKRAELAPEETIQNNDLYNSHYYYNAYYDDWVYGYYWDGYYYNRPYYQDRRHLRYDWFTGRWYYDPFYYNHRSYYYDDRWYYVRPPSGSYTGTDGDDTEQLRRTRSFGRIPGSAVPEAGGSAGSSGSNAASPDPGYVISGSSGNSSAGKNSSARKSGSSSQSSSTSYQPKNDPPKSEAKPAESSGNSDKKTARTKSRAR